MTIKELNNLHLIDDYQKVLLLEGMVYGEKALFKSYFCNIVEKYGDRVICESGISSLCDRHIGLANHDYIAIFVEPIEN